MMHFTHKRYLSIGIAVAIVLLTLVLILTAQKNDTDPTVTATAEVGNVKQLVSVSGTTEAELSAELAFPVTGIVSSVEITEGTVVEAGDVLVTLESRSLEADRKDALASLTRAIADRDELVAGPTAISRQATAETVALKQDALTLTIQTEEKKVENAYRNLLSAGLEAISNNSNEDAVPPTVTGTYACEDEGAYTLSVYSSGAYSGYSATYEGLESGTMSVSFTQPTPLGSCGLYLQFSEGSRYSLSNWTINIPNTKSSSYVTNVNTYNLAVTQSENAISVAEQELALAEANAQNTNAPARAEALARANAAVTQAQARVDRIDAQLADRVLRAPFAGTVTEIDILPGETVTSAPVVTLLAEQAFDVTARIPEIDIGKLIEGQRVEMVFDARANEVVTGEISFISLKATEIDGVAYYEATIQFDEIPTWIRSGLSADIDIVITEEQNVLRVPKRFVSVDNGTATVLRKSGNTMASSTVEVILYGDDGWVAISGINEGDLVVAP